MHAIPTTLLNAVDCVSRRDVAQALPFDDSRRKTRNFNSLPCKDIDIATENSCQQLSLFYGKRLA